jgi:hypothetical protein
VGNKNSLLEEENDLGNQNEKITIVNLLALSPSWCSQP